MCTPSHVTCNMSNSILSCNNMVGKYLQIEIDSKMVNDLVKDIELARAKQKFNPGFQTPGPELSTSSQRHQEYSTSISAPMS